MPSKPDWFASIHLYDSESLQIKDIDRKARKMKWEDNVRKVVPYVAGEQPNKANMIKLNTNECPYPPAPGVRKLAEEMDYDKLRLYPDTDSTVLIKELADYYGVKPSQVFVGVGSDDVLATAFVTFFEYRP